MQYAYISLYHFIFSQWMSYFFFAACVHLFFNWRWLHLSAVICAFCSVWLVNFKWRFPLSHSFCLFAFSMAFCNCFLWHVEIRKSFCLAFRMQIVLFCECTTFVAELSINSCKIITHTHTGSRPQLTLAHRCQIKLPGRLSFCPAGQMEKFTQMCTQFAFILLHKFVAYRFHSPTNSSTHSCSCPSIKSQANFLFCSTSSSECCTNWFLIRPNQRKQAPSPMGGRKSEVESD